jgi:hypothetical protein
MYSNYGAGAVGSSKRKFSGKYAEGSINRATTRVEPHTIPKSITHFGVDGIASTRPDGQALFSGGTVALANDSARYLFQIPGTQGTPIVRRTGDPLYSDRHDEYVFIKNLRLDFTITYTVPTTVRVFAFRKNNKGSASDFVFRAVGGDYNFYHTVRSGSTAGPGTSALDGILTTTGESPLELARDNAGGVFFKCPSGEPIDCPRSGSDIYHHTWSDMDISPMH